MDTAQGRPPGKAALPAMALSSSTPKPRGCWPGPGTHWGGFPFTTTLHPHPPFTQPRCAGGIPKKNTHFILSFIFLTKGLHIIICLTKTKVLVSEFKKHFPRINGKESLINIF